VVGVFDFDRANIDLRAFDVALAVIYFCCTWGGAADGHIRLDTLLVFLEGYQGAASAQRALGPLNALELASLPALLAGANLVLIKWATADTFYAAGSTCNSSEYLSYLQHQVQLMYWLRRNRAALSRCLQQLADGLE
jgi:homoserine kinase type II